MGKNSREVPGEKVPSNPISVDGLTLKEVYKFTYLGCSITNDDVAEIKLESRIEQLKCHLEG